MPDTIGFIGLGIMGKPMAHNLLKAGFAVVVHNRHQEVTDELVAAGASAGDSTSRNCCLLRCVDYDVTRCSSGRGSASWLRMVSSRVRMKG